MDIVSAMVFAHHTGYGQFIFHGLSDDLDTVEKEIVRGRVWNVKRDECGSVLRCTKVDLDNEMIEDIRCGLYQEDIILVAISQDFGSIPKLLPHVVYVEIFTQAPPTRGTPQGPLEVVNIRKKVGFLESPRKDAVFFLDIEGAEKTLTRWRTFRGSKGEFLKRIGEILLEDDVTAEYDSFNKECDLHP